MTKKMTEKVEVRKKIRKTGMMPRVTINSRAEKMENQG